VHTVHCMHAHILICAHYESMQCQKIPPQMETYLSASLKDRIIEDLEVLERYENVVFNSCYYMFQKIWHVGSARINSWPWAFLTAPLKRFLDTFYVDDNLSFLKLISLLFFRKDVTIVAT
jgi:hypothetical protein